MKKISILSLAAALALSAAAQTTFSGSTLYGYCTNAAMSTGLNGKAQLGVAMQLNAATIKTFAGCKITAIAVANGEAVNPALTPSAAMQLFVSETLTDFDLTFSGEMDFTDPYAYKEYPLSTPIEINDETPELFFGYSIMCDPGKYWPLVTDATIDKTAGPGDYVGQYSNSKWAWQQMRESVGMPCVRLKIEGDNMAANSVTILEHHLPTYAAPGLDAQAGLYPKNMAYNAIESMTVSCSVNGGEAQDIEVQLPKPLLYNEYADGLIFDIPMPDVEGNDLPLSVEIAALNDGASNNASQALRSASSLYLSLAEGYPRAMVVEEATGTWCGYCPRGIVGMHAMADAHAADGLFIPIAAHSGDRMAVQSYSTLFSAFTGGSFPNSVVNRNLEEFGAQDPSLSFLEEAYKVVTSQPALCRVDINSFTLDPSTKKLNVKAQAEFAIPVSGEYGFCYVLTEDNVGPYSQTNYFSPSYGTGMKLDWWDEQPASVSTYYDHTARYIYPFRGLQGSIPADIVADMLYDHEATLPTNSVTNLDNAHIIVMVINRTTGRIENAKMVNYEDPDSSIGEISATPAAGAGKIYDLQGRPVANPSAGIYIIDGKKVLLP